MAPRSGSKIRTAITLAAATACLGVAVAPPAHAATRKFHDKRGDVAHPADIRWTRVSYGKALRVQIKVRNITNDGDYAMFVDRRRSRRGPEVVAHGSMSTGSYDWMTALTRKNWRPRIPMRNCSSEVRQRLRRDVIRIRLSRNCLRTPKHRAPKRIRIAVLTGYDGRANDWSPAERTFHQAVRRG